ncbi:DUF3054 domain-containing protein [Actinomadura rupiterrae]|uniref:DUF3054 domain-containing protein n=1 Tax=Actinomadura rupiterrae TaxID=559627 RepID=UPI0020A28C78|nr:DUF3054 domain-containing protein [Actinomadura rupiterrae]MCP2340133.1 FtsH-binding integral membrane protein [Actinomadura rupiterrae]
MRNVAGAAIADAVCVLVFVAIGRASHDEAGSVTGFLNTAWPFLAGALIGWLTTRAWRAPAALVPSGLGIWIAAVAGGMLLRVASGQGIAVAFVIVATLFLGLVLLGWRVLASLLTRRARTA